MIEFEEPRVATCECCGRDIFTLTRFVHQDGDAVAVYHAKFTWEHVYKIVYGLVNHPLD